MQATQYQSLYTSCDIQGEYKFHKPQCLLSTVSRVPRAVSISLRWPFFLLRLVINVSVFQFLHLLAFAALHHRPKKCRVPTHHQGLGCIFPLYALYSMPKRQHVPLPRRAPCPNSSFLTPDALLSQVLCNMS